MEFMNSVKQMQNYHDPGESPCESNLEQFGKPVRSLYTEAKLASLHSQVNIMDENEQVMYQTSSKVVSIKGKTDVLDMNGNLVAHIEKRPISLHEMHFITMADGREFTLSNELFHLVKDLTNIEELGWQLRGNIMGLNFTLFDANEAPVATIGQKVFSLRNKFSMDIYQPEQEQVVVAIVIALQKMLAQRQS